MTIYSCAKSNQIDSFMPSKTSIILNSHKWEFPILKEVILSLIDSHVEHAIQFNASSRLCYHFVGTETAVYSPLICNEGFTIHNHPKPAAWSNEEYEELGWRHSANDMNIIVHHHVTSIIVTKLSISVVGIRQIFENGNMDYSGYIFKYNEEDLVKFEFAMKNRFGFQLVNQKLSAVRVVDTLLDFHHIYLANNVISSSSLKACERHIEESNEIAKGEV